MRDSYSSPKTSVLVWLISAIVAAFVLQAVMINVFHSSALEINFGASPVALARGHVWTLFTYPFLHGSAFTLICFLISLYFLGREVLALVGPRRFLGLFFISSAVGAGAWSAAHWTGAVYPLMGCGPALASLLIVFACFYPDREMQMFIFFVFPVTVKPKYVAYFCLGVALFGFAFYDLGHAADPIGGQYAADLGGMLAGWIYYRYIHNIEWGSQARSDIELPSWMKRSQKSAAPASNQVVNISNRSDLRAEVDRILDKINSQGFGALTADEKRLLDEAKDLLSRR